jgi:hypothetical protein
MAAARPVDPARSLPWVARDATRAAAAPVGAGNDVRVGASKPAWTLQGYALLVPACASRVAVRPPGPREPVVAAPEDLVVADRALRAFRLDLLLGADGPSLQHDRPAFTSWDYLAPLEPAFRVTLSHC